MSTFVMDCRCVYALSKVKICFLPYKIVRFTTYFERSENSLASRWSGGKNRPAVDFFLGCFLSGKYGGFKENK